MDSAPERFRENRNALIRPGKSVMGGRMWPWGVAALIGFLMLSSFFVVLLRPEDAMVETVEQDSGPSEPEQGEPASVVTPIAAPVAAKQDAPVAALTPSVAPLTVAGPKLALLVIDIADAPVAEAAIKALPESVDLGFLPGAPAQAVEAATRAGHQTWLGLPMEPKSYPKVDPGPDTLRTGAAASSNGPRLQRLLARLRPGTTGVYNITGSAFTADQAALAPVLDALEARQLAFFDTRSGSDTIAARLARQRGLPTALNMAYVDEEPTRLAARLDELAVIARRDGAAVGVLSPNPASLAAAGAWLASKGDGDGFTLVSARALAATPGAQRLN
jgi:uncharacterized protein